MENYPKLNTILYLGIVSVGLGGPLILNLNCLEPVDIASSFANIEIGPQVIKCFDFAKLDDKVEKYPYSTRDSHINVYNMQQTSALGVSS